MAFIDPSVAKIKGLMYKEFPKPGFIQSLSNFSNLFNPSKKDFQETQALQVLWMT